MTLLEKQQQFTRMVGDLIRWVYKHPGWGLTFGEAWRTEEQAKLYAVADSPHCRHLAVDLNLFVNGAFQSGATAYLPLGLFWEHLGGSWGGRCTSTDADHFSLEYEGIK